MQMTLKDKMLRKAFSYQSDLTAYAYGLTRDWSLAQDAYQEAVIAMSQQLEEYKICESYSWLKSVTRNKAIDMIRKQETFNKTRRKLLELIDVEFDAFLDEDGLEVRALERKALTHCMSRLRKDIRQLIVFFYKEKKSCVQLAKVFKRSENALRLTLSRSRSSLKSCVKKELSLYE
ncbi:MAG: sigma-70 family RNA polymerase sigma factor [Lentisphaeraceae bacterium]|nr:sigma-70 family RNA polymerase sigma factor [Lentisphaeraceae bacterium]